jgi:hypothetical protein
MMIQHTWQELYHAALLELRPEELRRRIDAAEGAVLERLAELRRSDSGSEDERRALDDALWGLRVIVQTECKPRPPVSSMLQESAS